MTTTARTIFAVSLGLGLAFAIGCGSKPTPPQPSAESEPSTNPEPKPNTPKVEPAKLVWEMDPTKHAIPNAPVRGNFGGAEVNLEAVFEGHDLVFRPPQSATPGTGPRVVFKLRSSPTESLENRK